MGLGRTRLSIRPDSAFHLGKWPKTRIFRNFELRRIRKAFCPASPKIILEIGLGLICRFQPPAQLPSRGFAIRPNCALGHRSLPDWGLDWGPPFLSASSGNHPSSKGAHGPVHRRPRSLRALGLRSSRSGSRSGSSSCGTAPTGPASSSVDTAVFATIIAEGCR